MNDPVGDMLARSEYRGLWRSQCLEDDGTVYAGWAVTFVHDGHYWETPYRDTPGAACQCALDRLVELG